MSMTLGAQAAYDPRTKLEAQQNEVFLTGTQALVRLVLDQMRRDRARGLRTAAFVSGYPGSPLGNFDLELGRQRRLLDEFGVTHLPGHNEEIAATSVYGTQMAQTFDDATHDGVLGVWYGKGPGLDRAADAIRHAQYVGTSPHGGVLAIVGDDPACKSSSIPNTSENTLIDLGLPVLAPSGVEDVLDVGAHGVAMSRLSGLWTGIRIVTDVADATATVPGTGADPAIVVPEVTWRDSPFTPSLRGIPGPPWSIDIEAELRGPRLAVAREYGYLNRLNRIVVEPDRPRVSIVAVGNLYGALRASLHSLGLDDQQLRQAGIRLCQVRLQNPLDDRTLREFAADASHVIVVEEKRPLVERRLREALYGTAHQPVVVGKTGRDGRELVPAHGAVHADELTVPLYRELTTVLDGVAMTRPPTQRTLLPLVTAARAPYFCSGCPHNTSTKVPDGGVVGGGIGCHGMTQFMDPQIVGRVASTTHMGCEGAQWFGIAPYVVTGHMFQNLGDGTYFHSGQLAVQAAVAAGAHLTYKLLYNGAIAMTGGQDPAESNALPAEEVAAILMRQGVSRVIITTDDRERYRRVRLPRDVAVWDRSRVVEAQETLRGTAGVTVLIHDQRCAAENRRDRKRGRLPEVTTRVVINERICEGCGDCGVASNCLSVEPVDTEFGRKTRINQTTCNSDFSCLAGDCPSFLTVRPARAVQRRGGPSTSRGTGPWSDEPPAPRTVPALPVTIRMPGIGGTGVVTASQILGTAAMLEGKTVHGMDQTGLSQKAGPVISDLIISDTAIDRETRASAESVDVLLGFDMLGSAAPHVQQTLRPGASVAVISTTRVPTGAMVSDPSVRFPDLDDFRRELTTLLGADRTWWVDAVEVTRRLFGSSAGANVFLIGVALQSGSLPVSPAALEEAVRLNGVAVEANLAALNAGRWFVADPRRFDGLADRRPARREPRWFADLDLDPDTSAAAEFRVEDLIAYQDARYARRYVGLVHEIAAAERRVVGTCGALTSAVIHNLYKLMAYKDEYEVARLALDPTELARVEQAYGPGARVRWNLHPPLLRDRGLSRKVAVGPWFRPAFEVLTRMRRLRGTRLDPFGRTEVRRLERLLVEEYMLALRRIAGMLSTHNHTAAVTAAELPDGVRGYELLKLRSGERFRAELASALGELDRGHV
jgi:indolepyruvate ferredoxin oxidoreductase